MVWLIVLKGRVNCSCWVESGVWGSRIGDEGAGLACGFDPCAGRQQAQGSGQGEATALSGIVSRQG